MFKLYRGLDMNGHYAYTSNIWPPILTVLFLVALASFGWRRRSVPGAIPFLIACLFASAWGIGWVMEYAAAGYATKIIWSKFQMIVKFPIVIAVTCFVLEYAWPGRWLTRRNLIVLIGPAIVWLVLVVTNDFHSWIGRDIYVDGSIRYQVGLGGWLAIAYAFLVMGTVNFLAFGWLFLHSSPHRWPVVIMLTGQLVGRSIYTLETAGILISPQPLDLLGMAFEFLMYAIALFGFHIFDPIPLARQTAIEQMHSGMLVLDPKGNIVNLNPAAQEILGPPAKHLLGHQIQDLLPSHSKMAVGEPYEISLQRQASTHQNVKSEMRCFQAEVSALNDWRGLEIGRLLTLRDITEQKQAQAQLLEQQRALAMLHEREQLARELHDSLGQVLGFASLKMSATRKLLADGKLAKADDQLAHLESSLAEAQADVREYILNLRTAPTAETHFFSALQKYMDGFRQNYGIQIACSIETGIDDSLLTPEAQIQMFRIIQEAISNARKHAGINFVHLSFERQDSSLYIRIEDNGQGFDPLQAAGAGGSHFGLRIMRERAEQLGGKLLVRSIPGEGTCVEVEVPVGKE